MYRRTLSSICALGVALAAFAAPHAAEAAPPQGGAVFQATDRLARQVAADRATRGRLAAAEAVDLATVPSLRAAVRDANRAVAAAKGLPAGADLVRARVADPGMLPALRRGVVPLVAATPTDDGAAVLVGYEPSGRAVRLDAATVPARPVILVEVDTAKALPLGLSVVRQRLGAPVTTLDTTGYWATKVDAVRLGDDMEPWFKGGAEVYSIVGGFGLDGVAKVDVVQMPYLDDDGTTYYPNQLLVHFSAYKYNLADVVMMEDDGDTNYQALAQAIATALLTIADLGVYAPLVDAILAAIPTSWYTDDADYVDSWYTLSTASAGHLNGAAGNGWIDVSPYWVAPL